MAVHFHNFTEICRTYILKNTCQRLNGHLETGQTFITLFFANIVMSVRPFITFGKDSITDPLQGLTCVLAYWEDEVK